jgi:two-component system, chemotaxis family, chemotaxis protein CheY
MDHRLMIVDDSLIIRNRIARLCTDQRLPPIRIVGLAADGVQALRIAGEQRPTLVTMDLTMPNMDGESCIAGLAELLPDTRILVISALSDKTTALRAIRRGAQGFLHKPFDDDTLVASLQEILQ